MLGNLCTSKHNFLSNFEKKNRTLSENLKYNNIDNKTGKGDPTTTFNPLKVPCSGNFVSCLVPREHVT